MDYRALSHTSPWELVRLCHIPPFHTTLFCGHSLSAALSSSISALECLNESHGAMHTLLLPSHWLESHQSFCLSLIPHHSSLCLTSFFSPRNRRCKYDLPSSATDLFACVHILWIHSSLEAAIEHYGLKIGKVIGSGVGFTEKDDQSLSVRVWPEAMGLHFWANFMNMHFGVLFTL